MSDDIFEDLYDEFEKIDEPLTKDGLPDSTEVSIDMVEDEEIHSDLNFFNFKSTENNDLFVNFPFLSNQMKRSEFDSILTNRSINPNAHFRHRHGGSKKRKVLSSLSSKYLATTSLLSPQYGEFGVCLEELSSSGITVLVIHSIACSEYELMSLCTTLFGKPPRQCHILLDYTKARYGQSTGHGILEFNYTVPNLLPLRNGLVSDPKYLTKKLTPNQVNMRYLLSREMKLYLNCPNWLPTAKGGPICDELRKSILGQ